MVSKFLTLTLLGLGLLACGSDNSDEIPTGGEPILIEVSPATASSGQQVTLKGVGFSLVPSENIVVLNGTAIQAASYTLTGQDDRPEAITFTVPAGLTVGASSIIVTVFESPSNSLSFSITP